jgi:predicted  nucleic acid-binding Zn-ribbon protein
MINDDPYWFEKKWGLDDKSLEKRIIVLENLVAELQDKIRHLEEENVSTTNELYRLENSLDARIDIIAEHCRIDYDV